MFKKQSQEKRVVRKCKQNSNKIGVWEVRVILSRTSRTPSQVADKNAYTEFYCKLRMNLFDTNIEVLKFCFSGWWIDAALGDYFLQHLPFRLKFGRHSDWGERNNPSKFRQNLNNFTMDGIFIQRQSKTRISIQNWNFRRHFH